ncbi:MAG TPA: 8-amino-7-oxononanoate synthase [Steroidobacter sp.]
MTLWRERAQEQLEAIRKADRFRSTIAFDGPGVVGTLNGRHVVSFASNDYLGLTAHPRVREAAQMAIEQYGSGSGASRLITGTRSLHHELETAIARWKGTDRALVFSSGYAANVGVLSALGAADVTILSDELNHASIIDGCRLAKARTIIYRHNDVAQLTGLMESTPGPKLVVTEAIFSMDGDAAPLSDLARLCAAHRALLVVDEAHAVLGPEFPEAPEGLECLRVGTLSKTLAATGGWVAGPSMLIDLLVNRARTFIYTTAPTPADMGAALAALSIYRSEEGTRLRERLRRLVHLIQRGHGSAIIPLVLGPESAAIAAAKALLERGFYIPSIRPPTVPVNTARLRIALSAAHTDEQVEGLLDALRALRPAGEGSR